MKSLRPKPRDETTVEILKKYRGPQVGSSDAVAYVIDCIDRGIGSGVLQPGQRLVEADLATDLEVGRGPVREALRIMAGDGVIELLPNKGARIRDSDDADIANLLDVVGGLLCTAISALVRRGITPKMAGHLKTAQRRIEMALEKESLIRTIRACTEYQLLLGDLSGNPYFNMIMARLHMDYYNVRLSEIEEGKLVLQTARTYQKLTALILAGDIKTATGVVNDGMNLVVGKIVAGIVTVEASK